MKISHPEWCGSHPKVNFNVDICDLCSSEVEESCFINHPESILHTRQIDFPMDWFGMDSSQYNLWVSQTSSQTKPNLYAAYGSLEIEDAYQVDKEDLERFVKTLNDILKKM